MNKLALGAAAFACGALIASSAGFAWNPVPANDPNCPGCLLVSAPVYRVDNGGFCSWAFLDSVDGIPFTIGVDRVNNAAQHEQVAAAFATSYWDKDAKIWKGDILTIEYRPGVVSGNCATGGIDVVGMRSEHPKE